MRFLLLLGFILYAIPGVAHDLEFIFYRAPKPLDWSTPGSLVRSTVRNSFAQIGMKDGENYRYDLYPHAISHVNVKLQCGTAPAIYRGMTSDRSTASYAWDLMARGRSLETFLIDVKGRFYKNDEVLKWLSVLESQGYVRRFQLKLNEEQCQRVQKYLREYESLYLQKIYGSLRADPQWGQGAGCAAFAVSFLKVLNLFPETLEKYWRRHLLVPLRLLSFQARKSDLSFWAYLRGEDAAWASETEPHIELQFYDPELMYNWVGARHKVVWDVRSRVVPESSFFRMSRSQTRQNQEHRLQKLNQLLSEKELRDPFYFECRKWGYCGPGLGIRK
ncbi:hypothetical protein [Bdellovibrio svalbardensis]|uniref:Uncharacterized protein n=1 Tax=Bdellovibrio svalbardensis TaxID=2972972 RepID=A0ABT6DMD4_9BACT|nr:hypothetical protein [Bdellovibrio svalbardensis]MDG0818033.1 hypothetical protein [Bdellovibrio svalbardensis]